MKFIDGLPPPAQPHRPGNYLWMNDNAYAPFMLTVLQTIFKDPTLFLFEVNR